MKVSLKTKATLLASTLVVGVLAVVGMAQYRQLGEAFMGVLQQQQDALASTVADDLADKVDTLVTVLEQTAMRVDERTLADRREAQDFVSHRSLAHAMFDGVALIGLDGEVLANHPPLPEGMRVNIGDRDYFQRARDSGRWSISDPLQARSTVGPTVVMVTPVRSAAGRTVGFVGGGFQLQRPNMLGLLSRQQVGRTGHFEVATRGRVPVFVVHPDAAKLLTVVPAPPSEAEAARPSGDVVTRKNLRNVDWELRVVLPAAEVQAPLRAAEARLVRDLALMGGATALLVWLAMHLLLKPLTTLHDSIRRLRQSPQAELHLDTAANDERGELAREFEALIRELHARQAELAVVTERSPLGFFRADGDGLLTYVNDAYLQMHGLSRDEAPRGWLQLVRAEARDAAWAGWLASVRQAVPFTSTRRIRRADGAERQLIVRCAPVVTDGTLVAHVGTVADITDRANQEKALRLLTTIFDNTSDYVVQTDLRGYITYMNPAARRLGGIAADTPLAGRRFSEFLTPASNHTFVEEALPTVRRGAVWVGETAVCDALGREVPVSHMVIAHRDKGGRVELFSAVMRDLSSEASARRAAQLQAATLHGVAEAIPAVVAVVGSDRRYRYVNGSFERWLGRSRDAVLGRTIEEVLDPATYDVVRPWAERALAGEAVAFERAVDTPAGREHLALSYIPLRSSEGARSEGFVGIAHNITAHREEEARLQRLAERDPLTGLLNRSGFELYLSSHLREGSGPTLALLYIDLDHFKPVNDAHGHATGDEVLRLFAERLQRQVRPTDAVARLGGDEFAVVLTGLPSAAPASVVADKIIAAARVPFAVGGQEIVIGASVGVTYGALPGDRIEDIVSRADRLLYAAKRSGRGQQSTLH